MADFNAALARTLSNEGLYSNDPDDAGGETYKGISRKMHPKWEGWSIIDAAKKKANFPASLESDFKLQAMVGTFYKITFWNPCGGDFIESNEVAGSIFDFAVNAGVKTSVKIIQEIVGAEPDGNVGTETLQNINACNPIYIKYAFTYFKVKRYMEICNKKPLNKKYFFGWVSRAIGFIALLIAFNSCVSYERCVDKFGQYPKDTVFVPVETPVEVLVYVPSDSLGTALYTDTIRIGTVYEIYDTAKHMQIEYWKEKYTNLFNIKAKYWGRMYSDTVLVRDTIPCPPPKPILVKPDSWLKTFWNQYRTFAAVLLPLILIAIIWALFRRK